MTAAALMRVNAAGRPRRDPVGVIGLLARFLRAAAVVAAAASAAALAATPDAPELDRVQALFEAQVAPRLTVPEGEQAAYAAMLDVALAREGVAALMPQYLLLVDRNPRVQAALLLWVAPGWTPRLIGATPASTGKPGQYEHFVTPLGLFRHSVGGGDFRAEGTRNANGVLGYGPAGMRVFDFGWTPARRGWRAGVALMRLQLHSTDPDLLEPRMGSRQSKGCIRIPLSFNRFLDHYGVLDADYQAAGARGMAMWVLADDREPLAGAGRYLVVVQSAHKDRPAWAVPPAPAVAPPSEVP